MHIGVKLGNNAIINVGTTSGSWISQIVLFSDFGKFFAFNEYWIQRIYQLTEKSSILVPVSTHI